MMKNYVWVIEQGAYSNYRVVGVFSSKANADLVAKAVNGSDNYDEAKVSKWELDPAVSELNAGLSMFYVTMAKDGTTERAAAAGLVSYYISGEMSVWKRSEAPAYKGKNVQDAVNCTVWAKDGKHAVKIANEFRTQMIALGKL
jgi:hypothetical protein